MVGHFSGSTMLTTGPTGRRWITQQAKAAIRCLLMALALLGAAASAQAQLVTLYEYEASGHWRTYVPLDGPYVYSDWKPYSVQLKNPDVNWGCPIVTAGHWSGFWDNLGSTEIRCYTWFAGSPYGDFNWIVLFSGCPLGGRLDARRKCVVEIDPAKTPELLGNACPGPATEHPITIISGNKYLGEVDVPSSVLGGLELSRKR